MGKKLYLFVLLTIFYGCSSTSSTLINRDSSFRSKDFFNSSIKLYPPLSIIITDNKYSDYNDEKAKVEITNTVKEKIEQVSRDSVAIGKQKVPDYFKGILLKKEEAGEFLKDSKAKYIIFIKHIFIGRKNEKQIMYNTHTGGSYPYNQGVTKATIFFDVWNTESAASVLSVEIKSDVNEGLLENSLYSSLNNAIDEFIDIIKKY